MSLINADIFCILQVMRSGMLRTTLSGLRGSPSSGFGHGANSLTRSVALAVKISDSRYRFSGMNMLKSEDTVKVPSNWSFEQVMHSFFMNFL